MSNNNLVTFKELRVLFEAAAVNDYLVTINGRVITDFEFSDSKFTAATADDDFAFMVSSDEISTMELDCRHLKVRINAYPRPYSLIIKFYSAKLIDIEATFA